MALSLKKPLPSEISTNLLYAHMRSQGMGASEGHPGVLHLETLADDGSWVGAQIQWEAQYDTHKEFCIAGECNTRHVPFEILSADAHIWYNATNAVTANITLLPTGVAWNESLTVAIDMFHRHDTSWHPSKLTLRGSAALPRSRPGTNSPNFLSQVGNIGATSECRSPKISDVSLISKGLLCLCKVAC